MSTPNALPVVGYYRPSGQVIATRWLDTDEPLCKVSDALAAIAAASAVLPARVDGFPASADERWLRRMLCATRHGSAAYMDDGEASLDNMDYMRHPLDHIQTQWLKLQNDKIAAMLSAAPQPPSAAMKPLTCIWTEQDDDDMPGTYASACGEMWSFNDGGVVENNARFCQGCGKPIEVTKAAP